MLRIASWFLLFTGVTLFVLTAFFAKDGYNLYAEVFQGGVTYQGETRTKHYFDFLLWVIFSLSVVLGAGATTVLYQARKTQSASKK